MASSQNRPTRKVLGHPVEGSLGSYTSGKGRDRIQAATLSGMHTKLGRRAEERKKAAAKQSMRRGNSKPDSAGGTGRKWFS